MLADAHQILAWVQEYRAKKPSPGPLIVMGRSLGSASALELAAHDPATVDGLVVESGFARTEELLRIFGLNPQALGITEEKGFRHLDKIRSFARPTLIIHGEEDHLIPPIEGKLLFEASPARAKRLVLIPGADHNTLFLVGLQYYVEGLDWLLKEVCSGIGHGQ